MDPPEDGPGRVAPSVDVTSAGTPAGGAGTGVGRFRVGPGPSSDSPPEPRIDASGNPGRQSGRLGVGILSNIPVASVVNDGGAGSGRSWQSQRASVIGDGRTGRSPATSPARTRDAPISDSPLRELRGYAATETARRGSRRGRGTGSAPNTPEVKTGALPDETARWKSSLRAEIRGENGRPRDSAMRRQPRADNVADGREAAIDALIAEHEDALRTMKEEMDDERAEMIRSAERIRAEASEGVAQAAAQWLEERKFLNLRVDELETALRAAAEEAEAKRTEANEKFELEKEELRSRLESAVEEAAGKEAKMTERFAIEKGVVEERMESTRQEAAREVAAARDAQAREHERCKAEIERMTARMDEMREAHASEVREATEHLEIRLRQNEENAARRLEQQAAAWQQERESMESEAEATRVVLQTRLDAAKEDLSNYREHVEGKLAELREECDARGRRAREAREVAAEAESIRAEAVASAEAWRKEADLARAFAESARVDAEATLASERAAINEELEAMRAAHEIRVENARRDLEEERARDIAGARVEPDSPLAPLTRNIVEEYYAIGRSTPVSRGDTDDEGVARDDVVGGGWDEDEHAVRARMESWEGEIARSRRTSEPGSASLSSSPAQQTPHERATARDREARERTPKGWRREVLSAPVEGDGEPRRQKSRGLMMEPVGKNGWLQVSQSTF